MPNYPEHDGSVPPAKSTELSDLSEPDAEDVRGGATLEPCLRKPDIVPCVRPPSTIIPCVRNR